MFKKSQKKKFNCKFSTIIDLDVISPLRKISDIEKALKLFYKKACNLVSASISEKNPYFNIVKFDKKSSLRSKLLINFLILFLEQSAQKPMI